MLRPRVYSQYVVITLNSPVGVMPTVLPEHRLQDQAINLAWAFEIPLFRKNAL